MMTSFFEAIGVPSADTCISLRSNLRAWPRTSSANGRGPSKRSVSLRAVSLLLGSAKARRSARVPSWRMTTLPFCRVSAVYISSRGRLARAGRTRKVVPNSEPCDLCTVTARDDKPDGISHLVDLQVRKHPAF